MKLTKRAERMALSGVSILALGIGVASAQVSSHQSPLGGSPTPTVLLSDYALFALNDQIILSGFVSATASGSQTWVNGSSISGNVDVSGNTYRLTAVANQAANAATDTSSGTAGLGNRILSSQITGTHAPGFVASGPVVSAAATAAGAIGFVGNGPSGDSIAVTGNRIEAETRLNNAENVMTGLPSQGGTPSAGTAVVVITPTDNAVPVVPGWVETQIDLAFSSISNTQHSTASGTIAGSGASISDNSILLSDANALGTGGLGITGTRTLSDNGLSARYAGNSAVNSVRDINSGQTIGSITVTNSQANVESGALLVNNSASIADSGTRLLLLDPNGFSGTASVSGNSAEALTTGNDVANEIVFADKAEIVGENVHTRADLAIAPLTAASTLTEFAADFGIASVQRNHDTLLRSSIDTVTSTASLISPVNGGQLSVSNNTIGAEATGNRSRSVLPIVDGTRMSATAAIANHQANSGTLIEAQVANSLFGAFLSGDVSGGAAISVAGNGIRATATGNSSENVIGTDGASLDAAGTGLFSLSTDAASVAMSVGSAETSPGAGDATGAGLSVANVQFGGGGSVIAGIETPGLGGGSQGFVGAAFNRSALLVRGNTIEAAATGNSGISAITASAASASASAGTANLQISDGEVVAELGGISIEAQFNLNSVIGAAPIGDQATVTLRSNDLIARATGNTAANTIAATGATELILGTSLPSANFGGSHTATSANAALALVSNQRFSGAVNAFIWPSTDRSSIRIEAGDVESSVISADDNRMLAAAAGNSVDNRLRIGAAKLTSGNDELMAALVSRQAGEGAAPVSARISGDAAVSEPDVGIKLGSGIITGSNVAVTGNALVVQADGSFGQNHLLVTGTTHERATATGSRAPDDYNFVLAQSQIQAGGGARTATLENMTIGLTASSATGNSSIGVSGNNLIAQARNNVASNVVDLGFDSTNAADNGSFSRLMTTAILDNVQEGNGSVSTTVTNNRLIIDLAGPGDTADTATTASDNALMASAMGNVADNRMNIAAVSLAGGSGTTDDDVRVKSVQGNLGSISSSVLNTTIGTRYHSVVGTPLLTNGTSDVSGNNLSSRAVANSANNALSLTASVTATLEGGVLNAQDNTGAVNSIVSGLRVGVHNELSASNNPVTVHRNLVSATGYGNTASNTFQVAALPSSFISGGVTNAQINRGDVTATISNLQAGFQNIGGAVSATGTVSVRGNAATATAIGNRATNRVSRSNY